MSGHGSRSGDRSGKGGKSRRRSGKVAGPARAKNGVDYSTATKSGCSSGKWGWSERGGAKSLSKALRNSGGKGVREYVCPECGRWHVGHLPHETKRGQRTAGEVYGTA